MAEFGLCGHAHELLEADGAAAGLILRHELKERVLGRERRRGHHLGHLVLCGPVGSALGHRGARALGAVCAHVRFDRAGIPLGVDPGSVSYC